MPDHIVVLSSQFLRYARNFLIIPAILFAGCFSCSSRSIQVVSEIDIAHPAFPETIAGISGRRFSANNTVEFLSTGTDTFERLFEMIDQAEKSINIELYIYNTDNTGDMLADRLIARAQAGVRVNLIVDAVGGFYFEDETADRLRAGGVQVYFYNAWNHLDPWEYRIRTHRRVVVVDGRRGMVGGFAITDWWREPYHYFKYPVFDLQAYVEGEVVAQLQSVFLENWKQVSNQILTGPEYFPLAKSDSRKNQKTAAGDSRTVRAMTSGSSPAREVPHESTSSIYENYLFAIHSSRRSIRIFTPFFVPDQSLADALVAARKRGVDVRLVIPDERFILESPAYYAGHNYYEQLLEADVRMYHFEAGLLHSKGAVFDNQYALVGSTNFDQRSLKINYENDLHIYDVAKATELNALYDFYEQNSIELTLQKFRERGLWPRGQECLWKPLEHEF